MRTAWMMALALASGVVPAAAQDQQQARAPEAPRPAEPVYDMVAGDRETAWRINRVTGEVIICRVDTTGSLEAARARCAPAIFDTLSQQSRLPAADGRP